MLEEFHTMWDGHLGTIKVGRHRIELKIPDAGPIRSVPYRSGPAARTFEGAEIDRFLGMDVIEPTQT